METSQLARRIRAFRKLKGFTQAQLAQQMDISISILGAIERGNRVPDNKIINKISQTLNIDVSEILQTDD